MRNKPRDVLIRVPKVEPYSNSYVPPSARAKNAAKKAAASADVPANVNVGSTSAASPAADGAPVATNNPNALLGADTTDATGTSITKAGKDAAADSTGTTAITTSEAAAPSTDDVSTKDGGATAGEHEMTSTTKEDGEVEGKEGRERGNSPTIPFLSVEREESQTIEMSKAATSSAGWNSLLVWARRQRGAQWDASTTIWQVDKYSREYYSFCQDPARTDRANQPGDDDPTSDIKTGAVKEVGPNGTAASDADAAKARGDNDDDKGPTRVSTRNRGNASYANANNSGHNSPPPVAQGRSARLLRR